MKWISVKDKMPDFREQVLFYEGTVFSGYLETSYTEIYWLTNCSCVGSECEQRDFHPTYWMPLPTAPKEEE